MTDVGFERENGPPRRRGPRTCEAGRARVRTGGTERTARAEQVEVTTMIWTILAVIGLIAVLMWLF